MWRECCLLMAFLVKISLAGPNFNEKLSQISGEITKNYFQEFKCIIYLVEDNNRYLPNFTFSPSVVTITLTGDTQSLLRQIYDMDCRGFVLRVFDRVNMVAELIRAYKVSVLNRYNNKRYLLLPRDENDNDDTFLRTKQMYYMPDVIFVAPAGNSTRFEILAHNYFNGHKYDVLEQKIELLDVWYPGVGFERNETLYSNKMNNLYGKNMILALLQYGPYTLIIKEGDTVVYDGLETRIAAQFASLKNATWTGMDHPVYLWGDIFDNGTGNGILGSIYEHKADFGFSAIYQWHCDVLECSYPYIYAGVTCLVPRPLPLSGWYTILLPFEAEVWGVILLAYLFCSLFVFSMTVVIRKLKHSKQSKMILLKVLLESFFSTFRVHLEQSVREDGAKTPLFAFYKIWTVYCFFVAVCWQAGIASFLTVPRYEEAINDAHDLVSRWPRVQWGANHIDWTKSIEQSTEPILAKIVRDFVVLDDATLKKRVKARNFGYFMERLPNGHYGVNDYIDEEGMKYLRIMENNIYTANCVMVLPKCSPYLESLDKMLFWMFDTGLIQKLEIQTSLERINIRLQNMIAASTENSSEEDIALLISHIIGAICIYISGITFSLIVFLCEIFYHYKMSFNRL